jgi:hypothetical protein
MSAIRFGVGDAHAARSSLWRVWTGKKTSDVYVESRDVHGVMKFSLHETGDWHYGYRSEYVRSEMEAGRWKGEQTWWSEWKRPTEFIPGFTLALKFVVPREAITPTVIPLPTKKEIRWTPTPAMGQAVVFTLTFASKGANNDPFEGRDGSTVVGMLPLLNGERLLIHSHLVAGDLACATMLHGLTSFLEHLWQTETSDLEPFNDDMVLLGFSTDPSGAEVVTECPLQILREVWLEDRVDGNENPPLDTHDGVRFFEIEVTPPAEVFINQGVEPNKDPDQARRIFEQWRDTRFAEIQRLLSGKSSATLN